MTKQYLLDLERELELMRGNLYAEVKTIENYLEDLRSRLADMPNEEGQEDDF